MLETAKRLEEVTKEAMDIIVQQLPADSLLQMSTDEFKLVQKLIEITNLMLQTNMELAAEIDSMDTKLNVIVNKIGKAQ